MKKVIGGLGVFVLILNLLTSTVYSVNDTELNQTDGVNQINETIEDDSDKLSDPPESLDEEDEVGHESTLDSETPVKNSEDENLVDEDSQESKDLVIDEKVKIKYATKNDGMWSGEVFDGETSGVSESFSSQGLQAIKISFANNEKGFGSIVYESHSQKVGWNEKNTPRKDGEISGDISYLEAVRIHLTGEIAKSRSVYYRVRVDTFGWLGWAKNGECAGTEGFGKTIQGIQIVVLPNDSSPEENNMTESFVKYESVRVKYSTHVQSFGWQSPVFDGQMSGTSGQAKRLEGIQISVDSLPTNIKGGIRYRSHVQSVGWQDFKENGTTSGTTGQSKRLEAVQIELTGDLAKYYDVYYQVHVQSFGWLDWAKNGEKSGTEGFAYRLEGIRIKISRKDKDVPGKIGRAFIEFKLPQISYRTHVQTYGWQDYQMNGATSGTTGQYKRLEAIQIKISDFPDGISGGVQYKTHIQTYGWQGTVFDGATAGTVGQAKRLEAIQISLTGDVAKHYDIYYRTHCQSFGWLGWAKNGENSGTEGFGYRLEGIQIKIVKKGTIPPGSTANAFKKQIPSKIPQVQSLLNSKYRNGNYGIYVIDIKSNQNASINGTINFTAASTAKLPNIYYTQKKLNEGKISLNRQLLYTANVNNFKGAYSSAGAGILPKVPNYRNYSLDQVLQYTIKYSDNVGSNFLGYYVSNSYDRAFINEINRVTGRKWNSFSFQASAKDNALLMKAIYQLGGVANEYLTNTIYDNQRIPKYLPVKVGHKIGDVDHYRHDVAIVYANNPYIISVMTKNYTSYETISLISKDVYNILK